MSKSIPPGATVNKKWLIESLSKIAENQNPVAKLEVMLNALLDNKKTSTVFHHFGALFMLRELTNSQLAATDATIENLLELFNLSSNIGQIEWNPWTLQSEPYEVPERLSTTHIQFAVSVHRLTYYPLPMLSGQPERAVNCVL